ncbi:low molecular weight protein tyrosine phosphatase family protein, partial [Vibrio vulnificus]
VILRNLPMNILFICSRNKLRSPTGEAVFANSSDMEVRSAGISNDAQVPVSVEDVEWADVIFVMEQSHKSKLIKKFRCQINRQRIICLGIPDIYKYMDPELVDIFKRKVPQYL